MSFSKKIQSIAQVYQMSVKVLYENLTEIVLTSTKTGCRYDTKNNDHYNTLEPFKFRNP